MYMCIYTYGASAGFSGRAARTCATKLPYRSRRRWSVVHVAPIYIYIYIYIRTVCIYTYIYIYIYIYTCL